MSQMLHMLRSGLQRRIGVAALAAVLLATLAPIVLGAAPPQPLPTQRVDLKVLVVSNVPATNGPCEAPWRSALRREGVPFQEVLASSVNDGVLADYAANRANFQAVIVTTGVPLPAGAQAALAKFEATFGIRQISEIGDTFDLTVDHGISSIAGGGYFDQAGLSGQLTDLGRQVFPYLKGLVQIEGPAFGYQANPASASFRTLVTGSAGSYLGLYTHPTDLREEMVMTVSSNECQLHNQLLRHGMLNWVTRGVYLGTQRNYFMMHIDDIFLADAKWDPVTNSTPGDASIPTCQLAGVPVNCPEVRMSPADVAGAIAWQSATGLKLDFVFNGGGVADANDSGTADDVASVSSLLANKAQFRWINHTLDHENLDLVSLNTATSQINQNINFATANALPINREELVTGEHSGIGAYYPNLLPQGNCGGDPCPVNPNVSSALSNLGIRWVGDDNSTKPNQRTVGSALTVPRYPSNVYYNVATRDDQLDEYNHIYLPPPLGACQDTQTTTCRTTAATWADYVTSEAGIMFGHLMGNDPKPHYAHQSNLILTGVQGILYGDGQGVLDAVLSRYNSYFNVPLAQPTMAESGRLLQDKALWDGHVAAGRASGYLLDGKVHVVATQAMNVPLTGVNVGERYGGHWSGWTSVGAGDSVFTPVDPINVNPPSVAGTPAVNSTLVALTGGWAGTSPPVAPITTAYQWQRCNGPLCVNITGVIDADYIIGTIDRGYSLRVVQMAGNMVSSVSQAFSAAALVPGPTPPPGFPPSAPGPGNVPGVGASLASVVPAASLSLTNLKVSPRRFKVAQIRRGRIVRGTTVSWRLNLGAKVTIAVQKKVRKRWVNVGKVVRNAKAGNSKYRFTGRLAGKALRPRGYRFALSAKAGTLKSATKTVTFTVLRG